ncbi:glycosyltransferase [Patescibacteria group bacterium]|nr:glycosyltransferase [Patescibacteria group bacterium]
MKEFSTAKIAIFYDWLNQWGGAERLLLDLLQLFPQAELFTTVFNPQKTSWLPSPIIPRTSFLNNFPFFRQNNLLSALIQPIALEQFDFSEFDIVISLTSFHGQCLITLPGTLHLCYCLTPNRYLYSLRPSNFLQPFISLYQKIDYIYAQRPDFYFAISKTVQKRIQKKFHRPSPVIYPGVDLDVFRPQNTTMSVTPYFLVVSRLVPHKKIELAIEACRQTNNQLKIIGTGRDLARLQSIAKGSKTEFLGDLSQKEVIFHYQNCQALICPQLEDFGYTALEAQACGKPVIAYQRGGFSETIIDGRTGLLFPEQSVSSLIQALKIFPKNKFSPDSCRQNAHRFSRQRFMVDFFKSLKNIWQQYQKTTISW